MHQVCSNGLEHKNVRLLCCHELVYDYNVFILGMTRPDIAFTLTRARMILFLSFKNRLFEVLRYHLLATVVKCWPSRTFYNIAVFRISSFSNLSELFKYF